MPDHREPNIRMPWHKAAFSATCIKAPLAERAATEWGGRAPQPDTNGSIMECVQRQRTHVSFSNTFMFLTPFCGSVDAYVTHVPPQESI